MRIVIPCACGDDAVYRCTGCGKALCDGCAFRRERERLCEACCEKREAAEIDADLRGDAMRNDAAEGL